METLTWSHARPEPKTAKVLAKTIFPHGCEPCRCAYHVLLGDAHVKEPVGEFLRENVRFSRGGKVGIKYDNVLIDLSELQRSVFPYASRDDARVSAIR